MFIVKAAILNVLVLLCGNLAYPGEVAQLIYVRGVQCNGSRKYINDGQRCFAKSLNRTFSTVNLIASSKVPLVDIFLEIQILYKYTMMYREVMKIPFFDVCSLLKGSSGNKLISMLVDMANSNTPGLIHACPYTEINVRNASIKTSKMYEVFPSGDYKILFTLREGSDWIANVNMVISINSTDKQTFG